MGLVETLPLSTSVPFEAKQLVEKFAPTVDQDGKIRVPAGEVIGDAELGQMKYFVAGGASKLRNN